MDQYKILDYDIIRTKSALTLANDVKDKMALPGPGEWQPDGPLIEFNGYLHQKTEDIPMKFVGEKIYSMMIGKDFISVVLVGGNGQGGETKVIRGEDFKKVMKAIEKPITEALRNLE
jgi:hypothetical protein